MNRTDFKHNRAALRRLAPALAALAFALGGCSTLADLNPMRERDNPLPGERQAVFAEGEAITTWRQTPEGRAALSSGEVESSLMRAGRPRLQGGGQPSGGVTAGPSQ